MADIHRLLLEAAQLIAESRAMIAHSQQQVDAHLRRMASLASERVPKSTLAAA